MNLNKFDEWIPIVFCVIGIICTFLTILIPGQRYFLALTNGCLIVLLNASIKAIKLERHRKWMKLYEKKHNKGNL